MGRKRVPDKLKVARGTDQPCRMHPDQPEPPTGEGLLPPEHLSDRDVEYFWLFHRRLESLGLDSTAWTETMAAAAMRWGEIVEASAAIEEEGMILRHVKNHSQYANPSIAIRDKALRHLQSLLAEMGLTPASVSKTTTREKKPAENEFAQLKVANG